MIYGQWLGRLEGDNKGEVLMNIDKCKTGTLGSISFVPDQGTNAFPLIARIIFQKCTSEEISATIDSFVGFGVDGRMIFPHKNADSALSATGTLNAYLSKDGVMEGEWKTELDFKGTVKLNNLGSWAVPGELRPISWEAFKKEVTDEKKHPFGVFYRGQCNSEFVLKTTFHREKCWDLYRYHNEVISELFDNMASVNDMKYSISNPDDLASILFLAQHHSFPTPLLDWTVSPYVAAYFALREISHKNPAKYVRVYTFDAGRWLEDNPHNKQGGLISPGAIIKPLKISVVGNKRAAIQNARSIFTNIEHIDVVLRRSGEQKKTAPYLNWFDFDIEERDEILHDLKLMNIAELSLFPDIETACRILKKKYFICL